MSRITESAIKTPGVYINEIPTLPPSVAQVSTAIPIFIGYTKEAKDEDGISLIDTPTKIYSMLDYERYFGGAENEAAITVGITKTIKNGRVESLTAKADNATPSPHNMYYSLRLYFDNGGGPCYILSVALTSGTIDN